MTINILIIFIIFNNLKNKIKIDELIITYNQLGIVNVMQGQ